MATANAKSYYWRAAWLAQLFQNTKPAWEDHPDSDPPNYAWTLSDLYVSLHTADPFASNEAATQATSEIDSATFTWYARRAFTRNSSVWTLDTSDPAAPFVTNAVGTQWNKNNAGGSVTVTHIGIGSAGTGAGYLLYAIPLTTPVAIATNQQFAILNGQLKVWEK